MRLGRVRRPAPGLHARARGGAAPPGRLGADLRPAAGAALGRRGGGALPAHVDRRRARGVLPADRRLPRPLAADLRAGRGRARGRLPDLHAHARDGHRRRATAACAACRPSGATIEGEVVVNAGGMFAAEIGRMAGVRVPIVPVRARVPRHPAVPRARRRATCRRCATPTCSSTTARRATAWSWAATSATARRGRCDGPTASTRIPPDFNGRLLEEDWDRFEEIAANSRRRVPAMDDVEVTRLINGPEAFTPDNEFCLGETEVRGFFVAAGLLRARARRRRRASAR